MINIFFYISRANIYAGAQKFFDDFVFYVDSCYQHRFSCHDFWAFSSAIKLSRSVRFNTNRTPLKSASVFCSSFFLSTDSDIHFSSSYLAGFLISLLSLLFRKKHLYIVHGVLSARSSRHSILYYLFVILDFLLFLLARNLVFIASCDYCYAQKLPFVPAKSNSILVNNSIPPFSSDFSYPFQSLSSFLFSHDLVLPSSVSFNLCMTARFEAQKNQALLLEAIQNLPFISVCFFGDGKHIEAVKHLASSLNILDRVFFLGHVYSPYLYYNLFDLFVLVSRWESMPFSLIEALRSGLPFVSSDVGSCTYLSNSGNCGQILKKSTPDCLSNLLSDLSSSPDLLASMSRSAIDFFHDELSSSANYDKIVNFIEAL